MLTRQEIETAFTKWGTAWNNHDLDGVMELFHNDIYFENSGLAGTVGVRMEAISNLNRIRGYNNCMTPIEEIGLQSDGQSTNVFG